MKKVLIKLRTTHADPVFIKFMIAEVLVRGFSVISVDVHVSVALSP